MFEFLTFIPYELGTALAVWSALVATLAAGAAGFLNVAKENQGVNLHV